MSRNLILFTALFLFLVPGCLHLEKEPLPEPQEKTETAETAEKTETPQPTVKNVDDWEVISLPNSANVAPNDEQVNNKQITFLISKTPITKVNPPKHFIPFYPFIIITIPRLRATLNSGQAAIISANSGQSEIGLVVFWSYSIVGLEVVDCTFSLSAVNTSTSEVGPEGLEPSTNRL